MKSGEEVLGELREYGEDAVTWVAGSLLHPPLVSVLHNP